MTSIFTKTLFFYFILEAHVGSFAVTQCYVNSFYLFPLVRPFFRLLSAQSMPLCGVDCMRYTKVLLLLLLLLSTHN